MLFIICWIVTIACGAYFGNFHPLWLMLSFLSWPTILTWAFCTGVKKNPDYSTLLSGWGGRFIKIFILWGPVNWGEIYDPNNPEHIAQLTKASRKK